MPTDKPMSMESAKHSMTDIERTLAQQLGARLATVRNYFGHSQGTMATVLGIALPTLKGYERGRGSPSCVVLSVLASMGINIHWLVSGIGNMQSAQGANRLSPEERSKLFICIEETYRLNESLGLGMPPIKQAGMAARLFSEWMENKASLDQKGVTGVGANLTSPPQADTNSDEERQGND